MAVQQYTSDRGKSESLTSHPSASGRPQSLDEHNYDTSTGSNSGGIAQLRPTTSSAKEVASRQAIRTLMGISQFVEGNVNFLNFTLSPRELCSAFRLITGSRKYRAVGSTESPDGPIYFCPRDQGFSLLVIEQSPKMLGVKARNEIEGSNLCRFLEGFWEERQLNDQDLLRFEGSTEGTGVISDSAKCASTDATLFIGKDWDDMTVFTCEPPMYEFILRHTYQLRGISIP
ncbi:hypothetical protein DL98DRAFT_522748 [Cadophora sp. DSE1049]|nr:hypothetical protein DL98DRAFT_522748 [Cadophora sp. DSE1049]